MNKIQWKPGIEPISPEATRLLLDLEDAVNWKYNYRDSVWQELHQSEIEEARELQIAGIGEVRGSSFRLFTAEQRSRNRIIQQDEP